MRKKSGMTLVEVMLACAISFIVLMLIGELYADSLKLYKRTDFTQLAQKYAGVILESMAREIRGAVRIEEPTTNLIKFPIDIAAHDPMNSRKGETPYNQSSCPTGPSSYVAFSKSASPVQQRAYCYHYNWQDRAIYYYTSILNLDLSIRFDEKQAAGLVHDPNDTLGTGAPIIKRFGSDSRLTIENTQFWCSPDGVVIRVVITDTAYTRHYNYGAIVPNVDGDKSILPSNSTITVDNEGATATLENSSDAFKYRYAMRPRIVQSIFVAIRYYN